MFVKLSFLNSCDSVFLLYKHVILTTRKYYLPGSIFLILVVETAGDKILRNTITKVFCSELHGIRKKGIRINRKKFPTRKRNANLKISEWNVLTNENSGINKLTFFSWLERSISR